MEGTAAHALAELVLNGNIPDANDMLGEKIFWEERGEKVSWTVNADMVEYIQGYVDTVRRRAEEFAMLPDVKGVTIHVEEKVDFSAVIGIADQFGTADILIEVEFEDGSVMLSVEDLKYGMGVKVDAEGNEQLMTYGAGAMSTFELIGCDVTKVILAIHQVRLRHLSEFEYSAQQIRDFGVTLSTQANVAEIQRERYRSGTPAGKLVLKAGEKQCRFCKAKGFCPTIRNEVVDTTYNTTTPVTLADFDDLTEEDMSSPKMDGEENREWLGACMDKIAMIEGWCSAIRARVFTELEAGEKVKGYKLVEGKRGNRAWRDKEEAEEALKSMRVKQDDMYDRKLISPTKAEKLLKGSTRKWNRAQKLIVRADGKPSVAPESDKRPALDIRPASDGFDDLTQGDDLV